VGQVVANRGRKEPKRGISVIVIRLEKGPLTSGFVVERVRGIEPPLSAWESHSHPSYRDQLSAQLSPRMTVVNHHRLCLMARQWPGPPPQAVLKLGPRWSSRGACWSVLSGCLRQSERGTA